MTPQLDLADPVPTVRVARESGNDAWMEIRPDEARGIRIEEPATVRVKGKPADAGLPEGTVTIRWTPPTGRTRAMSFEPRDSGGWDRIEREWTGRTWRFCGREIVSNLAIESKVPSAVSNPGP